MSKLRELWNRPVAVSPWVYIPLLMLGIFVTFFAGCALIAWGLLLVIRP